MLLCGGFSLSAQTGNLPFPIENAYWKIQFGCVEVFDRDAYTCEDTVLNGQTYTQLYTAFLFAGSGIIEPRDCLRRDDQKVFFREQLDTDELLLYDFGLTEGDTAKLARIVTHFGGNPSLMTELLFKIEKRDSLLLPNGWRKRWKAKCLNPNDLGYAEEIWLEGVGSTFGPVDRFICDLSGNVGKVHCFWHNGQTEDVLLPYEDCLIEPVQDCLTTVHIANQSHESVVTISPNPFFDYLNVSFLGKIPPDVSVHLFDATGREVFLRQQQTGNSFQIERSNLPPGVYFLEIKKLRKSGGSTSI
ncbi:MAG: hypothetical protein OHK0019_22960 [Saprospiraceae bacterium]